MQAAAYAAHPGGEFGGPLDCGVDYGADLVGAGKKCVKKGLGFFYEAGHLDVEVAELGGVGHFPLQCSDMRSATPP